MKNIYSCFIILFFFTSCANDDNLKQEINSDSIRREAVSILPANSANPYDKAGLIYDEIFEAYYDGTNRDEALTSVLTAVDSITNINSSFVGIIDDNYQSLSLERVQHIANRSISDLSLILAESNLSANAKISFSSFLQSFVSLYSTTNEAGLMYDEIVKYEDTVNSNLLLTENDRQVILTTTSIIRYNSYRAKRKPKKNTDPDWIISVGHAFGTLDGANENMARAIEEGLVVGIVSNQ